MKKEIKKNELPNIGVFSEIAVRFIKGCSKYSNITYHSSYLLKKDRIRCRYNMALIYNTEVVLFEVYGVEYLLMIRKRDDGIIQIRFFKEWDLSFGFCTYLHITNDDTSWSSPFYDFLSKMVSYIILVEKNWFRGLMMDIRMLFKKKKK